MFYNNHFNNIIINLTDEPRSTELRRHDATQCCGVRPINREFIITFMAEKTQDVVFSYVVQL
jgi:hypothetical protein